MAITIKDIAKYAGVSVGTVSKVINNQGNVREDLRLRVESIIEKLNYRPSALARSIKRSRTDTIGLIIPKIMNSFYIQVIELTERIVNKKNYTLFLGNSDEDIETEVRYLRKFSTMRIDGLILASVGKINEAKIQAELSSYSALSIPVVLLVRRLPNIDFDMVMLDNTNGAYKATRYLLDRGHKRIGIISSSIQTSAGQERIDGYMKALEELQIPHDSKLIHFGGLTIEGGYQKTNELLGLDNPPSAIFVASNFQLLGALRALKGKNVNIPDEISLICFDDTEWSSFADPPLTVVKPLTEELCHVATKYLFERIDGEYSGERRRKIIPTELVVRMSVKTIQG